MPEKSYIFIINPTSGNQRDLSFLMNQINTVFTGLQYDIQYTQHAGHATVLARNAVEDKIDIVVAVGGDGTINEVGSALVGTSTAVGLIPRGSGNGFARSMGIPLQTEQALKNLINTTPSSVDAARINEKIFLGVAGLGLDAAIAKAFQNFGRRGPLPYFYIGVREFAKYSYPQVQIEIGEKLIDVNPLLVTIANTQQFGSGALIAPQADFQDGLLDICIIDRFPLSAGLSNVKALFNGKIDQIKHYQMIRTKKVKIFNHSLNGLYHIDGEPITNGFELNIEVLPKALQIIRS